MKREELIFYDKEDLKDIILELDKKIREANELIEKGAWSSAREKLKV